MDGEFYQQAQYWLQAGLSLIPIAPDGSKGPAVQLLPKNEEGKRSWKRYTQIRPTTDELDVWLAQPVGLGIIGGSVSGNLLIFDFDEPMLAQNFLQVCGKDKELADIACEVPQVATPSGGMHLYVRCTDPVGGSQKLARNADGKTRIETKGEGGYVLAPGCPRKCHPTKKPYILSRGSLQSIPEVTPETLEAMYRIARIFNQSATEEEVVREPGHVSKNGHMRPGDAYNRDADLTGLLEGHGWKRCGSHGDKQLWKRPGKSERGISATSNYADLGFFYVFSSNAHPFEANKAYSKFAVYTQLEHNGDYSKAASALDKKGYGDPPPKLKSATRRHEEGAEDIPEEKLIYPRTDLGNSERFVRDWGDSVRYCHDMGQWFVWQHGHWAQDTTGAINRLATLTTRKIYSEAAEGADKEDRVALAKWAASSESSAKIKSMLELAKYDEALIVRTDELDAKPWLLNAANGIINLATGDLYDHDPNAYLTRQLKLDYDPEAQAPRWEAFLERILPDPEVRSFVARAAGYALTGDTSEQCLFFLHGSGRNGKSTFIETISSLMSEYWTKTRAETIMVKRSEGGVPNDIAALRGRRLVTVSEVNDGQRLNEALIKDLTGGDAITARFLHAEFFTFHPVFKFFLHGNHKPQVRGNDKGIWRRINLIPFEVQIPEKEQDKHLIEKLRKELPGILAWSVRGCLEWQEKGLAAPSVVARATDEYRQEMDALGPFFNDCCTLGAEERCDKTELWEAYKEWAEKNSEKLFETAKGFNHCVKGHEGVRDDRYAGRRIWRGVSIGVDQNLFAENESQEKNDLGSNVPVCDSCDSESMVFQTSSSPARENLEKESHESHESQKTLTEVRTVEI